MPLMTHSQLYFPSFILLSAAVQEAKCHASHFGAKPPPSAGGEQLTDQSNQSRLCVSSRSFFAGVFFRTLTFSRGLSLSVSSFLFLSSVLSLFTSCGLGPFFLFYLTWSRPSVLRSFSYIFIFRHTCQSSSFVIQ